MKQSFSLPTLLGVTALLACAASVRVSQDYDPAFSFADLQTYGWIQESSMARDKSGVRYPLVESRIQDAVDRELAAKGYRKADADQADFLVAFHAAAQEKLDVFTTYDYYGYGWRGGFVAPRTTVTQYTEGTLILDIIDRALEQLIWRGIGTQMVSSDQDPEKLTERINEGVRAILADFPPQG